MCTIVAGARCFLGIFFIKFSANHITNFDGVSLAQITVLLFLEDFPQLLANTNIPD